MRLIFIFVVDVIIIIVKTLLYQGSFFIFQIKFIIISLKYFLKSIIHCILKAFVVIFLWILNRKKYLNDVWGFFEQHSIIVIDRERERGKLNNINIFYLKLAIR